MFGYSVFYFYAKLEIDSFVPALVYFSTMGVVSYVVFVMTGTVGFIACYAFVRRLYSAVKID